MDISRYRRYLTSTRHLVGCGGALVGLVIAITGVAGALWPLAVAGLYVVGVLLGPPDRRPRPESIGPRELREQLRALPRNRLPDRARRRVDVIAAIVDGLLEREDALTADPENWFAVDRAVRQDLPTTVDSYLELRHWYHGRRHLPGVDRDIGAELMSQLESIEATLTRVAEDVYGGPARWMVEHGRRLAERAEEE
ncbi:hypothetical protein Val02_13400 [Virgisporangium aliadipatigenens]|uniref:Uncharacterized protein n=1 Tax=Virgisporangium aliadipatigenens TaxID=741659 RepID=A0A8J4DNI4_9ACTN|nr:hypothetical protein [Virgisporangium aliadipatigenens]GIJ44454.1 hypothetical protein Val02_13400 [Virgisporangium aliadipatigenens]